MSSENLAAGAPVAPGRLPPGYAAARLGDVLAVARGDFLPALLGIVRQHGTLYGWAASRGGARALAGRGVAYAVDAPPVAPGNARDSAAESARDSAPGNVPDSAPDSAPGTVAGAAAAGTEPAEPGRDRWVVRHYRRGGAVARWLKDRYLRLGRPRPLVELWASAEARARGIRTPQVVALVVYPAGLFYRADLATAEVPGAIDLAEALWAEHAAAGDPQARAAALAAAGMLLRELADAGVAHPDLNAKNILLAGPGPQAWVLDLDGSRVGSPLNARSRSAARSRLARSLLKWERRTGRPLADAEWSALARMTPHG